MFIAPSGMSVAPAEVDEAAILSRVLLGTIIVLVPAPTFCIRFFIRSLFLGLFDGLFNRISTEETLKV